MSDGCRLVSLRAAVSALPRVGPAAALPKHGPPPSHRHRPILLRIRQKHQKYLHRQVAAVL